MKSQVRGFLSLAMLLLCTSPLFSQAVPTYGTTGLSTYTVSPIEMTNFAQDMTFLGIAGTPYRYITGGTPQNMEFDTGVHLPQGASVETIEVDGCDTSDTGRFFGNLQAVLTPNGGGIAAIGTGSGDAETPGCTTISFAIAPPLVIDNQMGQYWVGAGNTSFDGTTYVTAIRLYYRLQASPAPAAATFNDVPTTDPGFQYIEAFVAAGITAGCGGGNYCPDATVTRRQMAIFFSKALGLYWPN